MKQTFCPIAEKRSQSCNCVISKTFFKSWSTTNIWSIVSLRHELVRSTRSSQYRGTSLDRVQVRTEEGTMSRAPKNTQQCRLSQELPSIQYIYTQKTLGSNMGLPNFLAPGAICPRYALDRAWRKITSCTFPRCKKLHLETGAFRRHKFAWIRFSKPTTTSHWNKSGKKMWRRQLLQLTSATSTSVRCRARTKHQLQPEFQIKPKNKNSSMKK